MARPICGSRSAPSQPVRAAGSVSIHARIAWMTRMSAEPGDHRLAARPRLAGLGRHAAAGCSASSRRRAARRHEVDDVAAALATRLCAAGWSKRTAPQTRFVGAPAAAVAEDLVAVADGSRGRGRGCRGPCAGLAAQDVPLAVRHERELARAQQRALASPTSSQQRPDVTTWNHR